MDDNNRYYLPPDWECTPVANPLSEVHDWSLAFLGVPKLWGITRGRGIKVAILDTGVQLDHPDLEGGLVEARDFTRSMNGPADAQGHGTWCCGMIGARSGNDFGVAGIAPECSLFSGKVLGDNGAGTDSTIERGMIWAMSIDADIVSLSLGGPQMGERLHAIFREFVSRPGRFVFAAAGNDGRSDSVNFPARWLETICVAAVDKEGNRARFSSRGERIDIAAPGVDMLSTIPGGYGVMSGTSMATPLAAAVGALALAKHRSSLDGTPLSTVADMRQHLLKSARDRGPTGEDDEYGPGLIDPAKLLVGIGAPVAPPVPSPGEIVTIPIPGGFVAHVPAMAGDAFSFGLAGVR
jgi:subtilisin